MEAALQSPATSQRFRISATRTGGHQTEIRSHILTLDVDTYVGVGHDEAAIKLLYLALQNIARRWTRPVKDWKKALNQFAIMYEDRVPLL